jgi:polysaccharide chain length determinant protein (PEP-CTERM system associated)
MQSLKLRLFSHLMGAWRFRWFGLATAFIICIGGWFAVALIPNIFESEAKVYIDTDTLLRPLLKGLAVTTDADQQVNVMLRTLLSSTNVERVVRATDPSAATATPNVLRDKIESIQQRVALRDLGTANLYAIAFRDSNPRYAQSVTQSLLSVLIDSNLGSQRQDSDSARTFLDSQIDDYEQKLTAADQRRADFKASHLNFFSTGTDGAVDAGGGVVASAGAVAEAQTALEEAVARRNAIRSQLGSLQTTLDVNAPATIIFDNADGGSTSPYTQLAQARAKLSDLKTRYTDQYPDVVATNNLIARLQAEIASTPSIQAGSKQGISNPSYVALKTRLADEEANVAVAQQRLSIAQQRVVMSKTNALDALTVQRQYEDLNRDYQVLRDNYQQLVSRRESANISQAAGSQQSAIFRVIDPPLKPDRPVSPNRPLFNLLVLLAGLGCGIIVAIGMSGYQERFLSVEQLSEAFSIPVIGSITAGKSASDLAEDRRATMAFGAGLAVLMLGYLVVLLLFHTNLAGSQGNLL